MNKKIIALIIFACHISSVQTQLLLLNKTNNPALTIETSEPGRTIRSIQKNGETETFSENSTHLLPDTNLNRMTFPGTPSTLSIKTYQQNGPKSSSISLAPYLLKAWAMKKTTSNANTGILTFTNNKNKTGVSIAVEVANAKPFVMEK